MTSQFSPTRGQAVRRIETCAFAKFTYRHPRANASAPKMPSASAKTRGSTTGNSLLANMISPAVMLSTATVDTTSDPVIPRSSFARAGSATSFSRATTRGEITLLDAPVSTTNANGPTPFTNTGAITRPMRSGRVDAT